MGSAMTARAPAHVPEAERAVVGAVLLRPDAWFEVDLAADEFWLPELRLTYATIADLVADGEPVDPLTVAARMAGRPSALSAEQLLELVAGASGSYNVAAWARIVRDKAIERAVRRAAAEIESSDLEGLELAAEAARWITAAQPGARIESAKSAREICAEVLEAIGRRRAGGKREGLTTGASEVDDYLAIDRGGVLIIAGRPSMGKSAVAQWLVEQSLEQGERALVFSTESSRGQYVGRSLSRATRINSRRIMLGALRAEELEAVQRAAGEVSARHFWVDDRTSDVLAMVRKIRRAKAVDRVSLVVVDHLQEVTHRRHRGDDTGRVEAILTELRDACREEPSAYLVIVSQLNREVERRESKRPILADLRQSGRIEEIADGILLLYRPAYYDRTADDGLLEAAVAKMRDGVTGALQFAWDPKLGQCLGPMAQDWRRSDGNETGGGKGGGEFVGPDRYDNRADLA